MSTKFTFYVTNKLDFEGNININYYNDNIITYKAKDKKNGIMKFVRIYEPENLVPGDYGLMEPEIKEDSEIFDPDFYADESNVRRIDGENAGKTMVIVPGVAFDKAGNHRRPSKGASPSVTREVSTTDFSPK